MRCITEGCTRRIGEYGGGGFCYIHYKVKKRIRIGKMRRSFLVKYEKIQERRLFLMKKGWSLIEDMILNRLYTDIDGKLKYYRG